MVAIVLWHNVLLKQTQGIYLIQAHLTRGIAVRVVLGVLAEIAHLLVIPRHTELHTNLRQRSHRFHRLHAIGDADVAFTVNEIHLIDNDLQLTHAVIVLHGGINRNRVGIQPFKMQATGLGSQVLQTRLFPTRQSPTIYLVVQGRCTPEVISQFAFQKFLPFNDTGTNSARCFIESHREILIIDRPATRIELHLFFFHQRLQGCRRPVQLELIVGNFCSRNHQRLVFFGFHRKTNEELLSWITVNAQAVDVDLLCTKWLNIKFTFPFFQDLFR